MCQLWMSFVCKSLKTPLRTFCLQTLSETRCGHPWYGLYYCTLFNNCVLQNSDCASKVCVCVCVCVQQYIDVEGDLDLGTEKQVGSVS
jgi:hypothetical protein